MTWTINKLQIYNAITALQKCQNDEDQQRAHIDAINVLLALLPIEIKNEFRKLKM